VDDSVVQMDLGEKAYRQLFNEIVRCNILPGQDITEAEMCERYGLSRSPVRRALALLAHDGLITPIPRLGFHVSDISLSTIRETFEMRAALEGLAAHACVGRVDLEAVRQLNREYVAGAKAGRHGMMEVHNRIHWTIYAATHNPILEKFLKQLLQQTNRIAYFLVKIGGRTNSPDRIEEDEHEALFDALSRNDAAAAATAFQNHVRESEAWVLESLLQSRYFSSVPIRFVNDEA
jgi:DNA-binding GntR family transcriptional regulator